MILLPNRGKWLAQPQGRVEVDWGHPLAAGLVGGLLPTPGGVIDVVNPSRLATVITGMTRPAGQYGTQASALDQTTYAQVPLTAPPSVAGGGSMFVRAVSSASQSGTGSASRALQLTSGADQIAAIDLGSASAGQTVLDTYWQRAGAAFAIRRGSSVVLDRTYNLLSVQLSTAGATAPAFYIDGASLAGTAFAQSAALVAVPTFLRVAARGTGTNNYLRGGVYVAYAWNRALGANEAKDLDENPYQLLKATTRRVFLPPVTSGLPDITGTGAATQAPNTASASGAVAVAGTGAATQAVNTSSATGAVAVGGTGAATQGLNTTSGTGGVAVAGTAASTQQPNTASATGTVSDTSIAGTAAITQSAGTGSGTGAVSITGSAAITQGAGTGGPLAVPVTTTAVPLPSTGARATTTTNRKKRPLTERGPTDAEILADELTLLRQIADEDELILMLVERALPLLMEAA